ncbi:MAG: hypothetical protein L0Y66_15990 [Myxococcaceae bacterium]|nr:hypothetical protein [Myxococcaceae bacterium]MCI0669106.1 hypothetical protein [Myxococcaceae bacterium]
MGGASVGIADGAGDLGSNLASVAHRHPYLNRDWEIGVALSYLRLPLGSTRGEDLDNDGSADDAQQSLQMLGGVTLQFGRLGVGMTFRTDTTGYCAPGGCDAGQRMDAAVTSASLTAGLALLGDSLLVAAGVHSTDVTLRHGGREVRYGDTGPELGLLWRPTLKSYRLGLAFRPPVHALPRPETVGDGMLAGRPLPSSVVMPASLSLAGSMRLGPEAERYNRLSPIARRELGLAPDGEGGGLEGTWLLALQLDLLGPVRADAVPLRSFTAGAPPTPVGHSVLLVPRAGAEYEALPGRMRLRAGTYLEPSLFEDRAPRPHVTAGAQLFLLRYLEDWSISAALDAAPGTWELGVGVEFWR